ncbi:MAG: peptide chain release factor 1 [bacterium]|nr:peptide chain release factor 1 [bacterium]MDD3804771.1 peptide chain release factor 1 [bacterium]MDD4152100.1 peptide chain release factor 1 [bacterium]MDD4557595.1 peptide chain release factor 1 [bacterium]
MLDRLKDMEERYEELGRLLGDPEVVADLAQYQKYAKAHADLQDVVSKYREYNQIIKQIDEVSNILDTEEDAEFLAMARTELEELGPLKVRMEEELAVLLLPRDPYDDKNVIMEIRAGAGGDEAALFAGDLLRMYSRYAERTGWKTEMLSSNPTGLGGFKEVIILIKGEGAYSRLKFESGVHRVQRVPTTESGGRIHTSTATVAVLPEADEDTDIDVNMDDLRIDTYRSSSAGGQNVQKNETAIRITHLPTGKVVTCQDERSQYQNKEKAFRLLRSHLLDMKIREQQAEVAMNRKLQVGTGDRSEKIRTYNFPQNRITDHRISLTLHRLESVLDGDLGELVETLIASDHAERREAL